MQMQDTTTAPPRAPQARERHNEMPALLSRIREGKNVRVAALADAIGMSRGGLYGAIEAGDVEAVKIGRAVLVPARVAGRLLGIPDEPIAA
ncbi:hypothetical protein [Methylobacterium thuringiense]|uniref:Helix-turn-helix domain-containing protein n=1 Tax=Methylobacterium thuringiense TaxID=1003091 RepID=A0ABQ4TRQ8_9HYPH|nr:hypothetical protein [Methylobacterium thuringiense]GJE57348.1 hypothetical protein EKPJFOCH_3862 [Methylobacterium thuringiense]